MTSQVLGDWSKLIALFRDASPMTCSHWNVETGELFAVRSGKRQRALVERFEDRLLEEPGWLEVPFLESDDAYALIRDFVGELAAGKGKRELQTALADPKPFRAFRAVLNKRPGLQRRWRVQAQQEAEMRLAIFCLSQGFVHKSEGFLQASTQVRELWSEQDQQEGWIATTTLSLSSRAAGEQ